MLHEHLIPGQLTGDLIKEEFKDPTILEQVMIADEVAHLPEEKIKEFCKPGGVGEQLVAEGKMSKRTLVRLNKQDDLTRRTTMGALLLAKQHNDPLYEKLVKNRMQKKSLIAKIMKKYGSKGKKVAKQGQNEFLHGKKSSLPNTFKKFGGSDRLDT